MLIIYSKKNIASKNIAENIADRLGVELTDEIEFRKHRLVAVSIERMIDLPEIWTRKDRILVLSPHRSKTGIPTLTTHTPGNWGNAGLGGEPNTLNIAQPNLMRKLIRNIEKYRKQYGLEKYSTTYEVDHHGPTIENPITFVEIGSTEKQWADKKAGEVIARAVLDSLGDEHETQDNYFAIGGGHYSEKFTRRVLDPKKYRLKEFSIGHILPNHNIEELENMFQQAIEKSTEKINGVIIDKKSTKAKKLLKNSEVVQRIEEKNLKLIYT